MALTERLQIVIEAVGGQAGATFTKLGKDAQGAYANINKGSKEAEANASRFGSAAKAAALVGGTALAVGLVNGIKSAAEHYLGLADQTRALQRLTGATAQQASQFGGVLRILGVDAEGVSRGIGIFADHIARTPDLLTQNGVAIKRLSNGNIDLLGTLDNVRQRFQATTDATERDSIAKQLLGRSYQTLLPYLSLTNERLALYQQLVRRRGGILTQEDVDKAREFKVQLIELSAKGEEFKTKAGRWTVEWASNLARGVDYLSKINIKDFTNIFTGHSGPKEEIAAEAGVNRVLAEQQIKAEETKVAQDNLDKTQKAVASSAKNLQAAQQSLVQAHRAVEQASRGVADAQHALQKAHEGVANAQQGVRDAQDNLNRLLAKGAVDTKAVADAEKNLASATRTVQHAQESLADAQEHLNEVLAGASPDELTDAQLALERATIGVAQAQKGVAEAHKPHEGRNALDEASANLSLREAVQAQTEAQERLDAVKLKGTAQDKDVIAAQRAVRDAAQSVTDAINNQNDAAARLREAQAGDPDFDRQVAQAKRDVESASSALREALYGESAAAEGVRQAHQAVIDAKAQEQQATYNVKNAQFSLNEEWANGISLGVNMADVISDVTDRYAELAGFLASGVVGYGPGWATDPANADPRNFGYPGRPGGPAGPPTPGHAAGGPFGAGEWSMVGEKGPELVRFGASGRVFSNSDSRRLMGGGGSGVTVVVQGSVVSERELTEIVYRALTKAGGRYSALRN